MSDHFTQNHVSAAPPVPDAGSLERVREAARLATRPAVHVVFRRHSLRIAAAVTVAVLVLGAFVLAFLPRVDDSAFARQQAADALLLPADGSILHIEMTYASAEQTVERGRNLSADVNQRWSNWLDPKRERTRGETHNIASGALTALDVRSGDWAISYVGSGTGGSPQLTKTSQKGQPLFTPMGVMLDDLRNMIGSGAAKVTGTTTVGGDPCWVVTFDLQGPAESQDVSHWTVTLLKSNYRVKTSDTVETYQNANGHFKTVTHMEFTKWETVTADSLPKDFFSLGAPVKAAPKGTKIDVGKQ